MASPPPGARSAPRSDPAPAVPGRPSARCARHRLPSPPSGTAASRTEPGMPPARPSWRPAPGVHRYLHLDVPERPHRLPIGEEIGDPLRRAPRVVECEVESSNVLREVTAEVLVQWAGELQKIDDGAQLIRLGDRKPGECLLHEPRKSELPQP